MFGAAQQIPTGQAALWGLTIAILVGRVTMNKCLARSNKSHIGGESTKKRETATDADPLMKPATKIRFTEPQIALVLRAYPNCNLGHLTEVCFEFDHAGEIVDCVGKIRDGWNTDHDYAGRGLARLYEVARRQLATRQTSATILQFPNGAIK